LAAGAAALPAVSRIARAQTYPSRPVRIFVGFAAGGPADFWARLVAQQLTERLNQQFVVENRVGGGSNIAAEAVVRAPPDGYTLLLASISHAVNATLYDKLNYDFIRDIAPVAGIIRGPGVLVVHPSFPARTVPEFIVYVKANQGKINYAGGSGSVNHLWAELFKAMTGLDLVHIPYRGSGSAMPDVLSGQVPVTFEAVSTATPHIKAERLRPLAVTTATRAPSLPSVPTIAEFVPGYDASGWIGIGAPKNTPPAIIEILNQAINASLTSAKMADRFTELSSTPLSMTSAEFGKFMADETDKWARVIRAANIKAE
jgi:tripartite-type tricarboxylate transporter receptor subunit TctC